MNEERASYVPRGRVREEKVGKAKHDGPKLTYAGHEGGLLTNHSLRVADGSDRSERFVSETERSGNEVRDRQDAWSSVPDDNGGGRATKGTTSGEAAERLRAKR